MGGLGSELVTIGGIALAAGGFMFGSDGDEVSFLDVVNTRMVSSGELFVGSSSGFCCFRFGVWKSCF